jgi:hypothetical protein
MTQRGATLLSRLLATGLVACAALGCSGDDDPESNAGMGGAAGAMAGAAGGGQGGASGAAGGGQGGASGTGGGQGGAGSGGIGGGQGGIGGALDDGGMNDGSTVEPDAMVELPTTWTTGKMMTTIRTELAVAEQGGLVYVAGGYDGLTAFEVYDPAADSWDTLADLPVGLEHP